MTRSDVNLAIQQKLNDEHVLGAYPTTHMFMTDQPGGLLGSTPPAPQTTTPVAAAKAEQAAQAAQTVQNAQAVQNTQAAGAAPIQGMNGENYPGGISSAEAQSQRMKNPVNMSDTHMPPDSETAYQASLRSLLDRNVGYFVVATFMNSPNQPVTWQGILHSVGSDYVVIYQPDYERYVSGDLYSLKFVQFHNVKGIPYCAASSSWQGTSM